jgi:hypothetical protein
MPSVAFASFEWPVRADGSAAAPGEALAKEMQNRLRKALTTPDVAETVSSYEITKKQAVTLVGQLFDGSTLTLSPNASHDDLLFLLEVKGSYAVLGTAIVGQDDEEDYDSLLSKIVAIVSGAGITAEPVSTPS